MLYDVYMCGSTVHCQSLLLQVGALRCVVYIMPSDLQAVNNSQYMKSNLYLCTELL